MIGFGSRRGASNLGVPLAIAAFLAMGGLIYWLSITAEPTELVVEEEPEIDVFAGTVVDPGSLEGEFVTGYEGMLVRAAGLPFAQAVGERSFFVTLPQGSPFLIRMSDAMVADSVPMPSGNLTVTGELHVLTDSARQAWQDSGSISAADRPLVDFASHYIAADEIRQTQAREGQNSQSGTPQDTAVSGGS